MRRVLPMIFVCVSLVGAAVVHAHSNKGEELAYLVPEAAHVVVETLSH